MIENGIGSRPACSHARSNSRVASTGRPMARPDRPFDRRGQSRRGPISREHQIGIGGCGAGPARVFVDRRGERRPLFLDDLPWRKRLFNPCHFRDFRPNAFGEFFARDIEKAIGAAYRNR